MVDALGAHLERNPELSREDDSLIPKHPRIDKYAEMREAALETNKIVDLINEILDSPKNALTRSELNGTAYELFSAAEKPGELRTTD